MAYAVLQRDSQPPTLERLERAFLSVANLTHQDAVKAVRDAHGILLRGLDAVLAEALGEALRREDAEAEVVLEAALPPVPAARVVRHLEFGPAGLMLVDPMHREFALAPEELMLVAAGRVRVQEFRRERNIWEAPGSHVPGVTQDTISGMRSREHTREVLMLELLPVGFGHRFSLVAEALDFAFLGAARSGNTAENLAALVRKLAELAPHAGLNRGAFQLADSAGQWVCYPTRAAFFEELTWMLWRCGVAP